MPNATVTEKGLKPTLALPTGHHHLLFLYGTAWKADATASLVATAVSSGFAGVDTACQPKHYQEDLVGKGIADYLEKNLAIARESLYIQTKYTPLSGQDMKNIPYNQFAPLSEQVKQFIKVSLKNLHVDYIDSLLPHSPLPTLEDTIKAWKSLELFVPGKIRHLAISIRLSIVQNRFYRATRYDTQILKSCKEHELVYQGYWVSTGNPNLLKSKLVVGLTEERGWTKEQALHALVLSLGWGGGGGISVMNGATNEERMKGDLKILDGMGSIPDGIVTEFVKLPGE